MTNPRLSPIHGLALGLIAATFPTSAPASSVTLIEDGRPQCVIVVPRENELILRAAEDLRYHLRKMSGAEVPIVHDASKARGVGIYIDTKPMDVHVPGRLIDRKMIWPDGYVIEILESGDTSGVFLSSPRAEGVWNAVYGLLEDHLGCHWFTPGEIGEHVPQRRTVTLDIPGGRDVVKPTYEKRVPWYNDKALGNIKKERVEIVKWYKRNRSGGLRGSVGYGWQMFSEALFKKIPDLGPLVDGQRRPGNGLCMSHPLAVDIAAQWFIRFFNTHPEYVQWSFKQGDSMHFCECDRCKAMGSNHGAHMLIMSNDVIEKVNRVHPTKRISIMPYEKTLGPPDEFIPANPNLIPIIAPKGVDQITPVPENKEFGPQVERWMTMLPQAWSRDYHCWTSGPWPLFHGLQKTRDFYTSVGFTGMMEEYLGRNLGTDMHIWLSRRMAWNGDLRVEDLLNEFYPAYYGAAAQEMRSVYEQIERHMLSLEDVGTSMANIPQLYPQKLVDDSLARVTKAKGKVSGDRTLVARIERDENCLRATQLWLRFFSALGEANRSGGRAGRGQATRACRMYLDFVEGLDGSLTLGGGGMRELAERLMVGLAGTGTNFGEGLGDEPWPRLFGYTDMLQQGGKMTDAKSWSGFQVGPEGLYLEPHTTGEIIYDVRTNEDLRFKEVYFPGVRMGYDSRISLALPQGGHNKVQISLDQGRTWITAFEDLNTGIAFTRHDMTKHVGGSNQFLLKLSVQNTDKKLLALDSWAIRGTIERTGKP